MSQQPQYDDSTSELEEEVDLSSRKLPKEKRYELAFAILIYGRNGHEVYSKSEST
jgi:hypothetical protein